MIDYSKIPVSETVKESIKKWKEICNGTGVDERSDNCPLCERFIEKDPEGTHMGNCSGCPIYAATGLLCCKGTPYEDWLAAAREFYSKGSYPSAGLVPPALEIKSEAMRQAAQEELTFLMTIYAIELEKENETR